MPYKEHLAERLASRLQSLVKEHGLDEGQQAMISDCPGTPDGDESDVAYWLVFDYSDREADSIRLGDHYNEALVSLDRAFQPS